MEGLHDGPRTLPIVVADERAWLASHKAQTGLPWSQIAPKLGMKHGTLTPFMGNNYAGDNEKIAREIFKYRQLLQSQQALAIEMPDRPAFFMTPTARRIETMLSIAQRGRITVVAGGPGTSKTETVLNYQASAPNVWVATMAPSSSGVWTVLDRRAGADGLPTTAALFGELSVDAKAAVDPLFEAALILFSRDRIYVEPCRRVIDRSTQAGLLYLLVFPDGEKRVIREDELLMMAGLA